MQDASYTKQIEFENTEAALRAERDEKAKQAAECESSKQQAADANKEWVNAVHKMSIGSNVVYSYLILNLNNFLIFGNIYQIIYQLTIFQQTVSELGYRRL